MVYGRGHLIVNELERKLSRLRDVADTMERKRQAKSAIKCAMNRLLTECPDAFKQAMASGDGPLIDSIRAVIFSGLGLDDKMQQVALIRPVAGNCLTIQRNADGYWTATYNKKTGAGQVTEPILFVEEFPAVSCSVV